MSIAENPLMGPMRNSMGNFTTMNYNGQNIVRSKAFKPKKKNTPAQKNQELKFALLARANSALGGMTELGFVEYNHGKSAHNRFLAENMKTAFDLSGEVPVIDYTKLVVSKGSLPVVRVTGGRVTDEGITIEYETWIGVPKIQADDEIVALVTNRAGQMLIGRQARGSEETGMLLLPDKNWKADGVLYGYVFAMSADGKKSSNSVYVELK